MHIYKSQNPNIEIPTDLNLTELLHSSANDLPESYPVASDNLEHRSVTLGQLRDRAGRLAHGLKHRFKCDDQSRWALILPNGLAYMETVHAVLWLDGVFCPINHELKPYEIGHAFTVCKPSYIVVWSPLVSKVLEALEVAKSIVPQFQTPQIIVALGSHAEYPSLYDSFMSSRRLEIPHHKDTRDRLASIHLSSGTTGKSKGVGLTHYNYVANVYQCHAHDPVHWSPASRTVPVQPMVHIATTTLPLFLDPWVGVINSIMTKFDLDTYCKLIERHKATTLQTLPAVMTALLSGNLYQKYNFSSVKYLVGTGGHKKEVMDRILALGNWKFLNLYGMTEAAPYVAWSRSIDNAPPGQIGPLVPNMEARLCDSATGKDVPPGQSGELWVRGPNMSKGYIDNPSANATAFKDNGEWYNTGDVCTISDSGWLSIVGRTKELFKSSGFQVSPQELEHYLAIHPDIQEVSVGPTYDKVRHTDVATAYVVLKSSLVTPPEKIEALKSIQTFLDEKVSGYKKLRGGVWEVKGLQKNATGKVLRGLIADRKTGLSSLVDSTRSKL